MRTVDPITLDAATMVNLASYPIADSQSPGSNAFINQCRRQYLETGLCMLPDFILPSAREILAEQASAIADKAYFCNSTHNAYLTETDPGLSSDDSYNRQEKTFVGSVPYDCIDDNDALRRLYHWDPLRDFIGAVLGKQSFHRFQDPLGACSINVFVDGGEHGWHFDESEFTVTLMLQAPQSGGEFEYAPGIRGHENEKELVAKVLDGEFADVVRLPFTPGTLLIFNGSQTIHRVTRVTGNRPRLVPVLCYSEEPDAKNSEAVRKLFWGRTGNEAA